MNFFDAAYDPVVPSTSPPEPTHQRQQSLNEEVTEVIGQLGKFWGGFRKQSQTVIQAARKDLGDYVSQAQQELNKLTVTTPENLATVSSASRDVQSTTEQDVAESASPSDSTSTSASTSTLPGNERSPQSFFSRLQSSIPPELLTTVQNTQNTLTETLRHAPERVDLSQLRNAFENELQRVRTHSATARGEDLLRGAGDLLREAVRVIPPENAASGSGSGATGVMWDGMDVWTMPGFSQPETPQSDAARSRSRDSGSRRSGEVKAIGTRKDALLRAVRMNPEILKVDPAGEKSSADLFDTWVQTEVEGKEGGIRSEQWKERVEIELESDQSAIKTTLDTLVPSEMTEDVFWTRYFFRVYQIEQEEVRRKALLQGPTDQDDEFSWEDDDEEAPSPNAPLPSTEQAKDSPVSTADATAAISVDRLSAPVSQSATPATTSPRLSSEDSYDLVSSGHASGVGEAKVAEKDKGRKRNDDDVDDSGSDWE